MSKKKTTEEFIKEAKALYGDKYDYSKVEYVGNKKKVCIICPKHGEFWQTPNSHLRGSGCPQCGREESTKKQSSTKEQFIEKARIVHGDKYNYSEVEYINHHTKVKIICPIHGIFYQSPNDHLCGKGCPKCGGTAKSNIKEFIERAKRIHGNTYDYSLVDYKNNKTKVKIICPQHGIFEQTPDMHLQGKGCPKCKAYNSRKIINGVGIYDIPCEDSNWSNMGVYDIWRRMLDRCYSQKTQLKQPTYADCKVCEEWHYYSNYKKWYDEYYVEDWCVDKDILFKGNREYSPDKCCFVPNEINIIFRHTKRKSGLPVGVTFNTHNKYVARINKNGKDYHLGCFTTPEEAFQAYKIAKEAWIKEVANKWKGKIEDKVYNAMMIYEVEITD